MRQVLRGWWAWLAAAIALQWAGQWAYAIIAGGVAFFQYHTSLIKRRDTRKIRPGHGRNFHTGVYPLEADLDVDSVEFQNTIAGVTGMPFVSGNRVAIYNNGLAPPRVSAISRSFVLQART